MEVVVLNNRKSTITLAETGAVIVVHSRSKITLSNLRGPQGASWEETYESVSKNLKGIPFSLNYSSGLLTSVVYSTGITKTFNRTGNKITSIVLSGSTPSGIALTKTLGYTGDNLTSVGYS